MRPGSALVVASSITQHSLGWSSAPSQGQLPALRRLRPAPLRLRHQRLCAHAAAPLGPSADLLAAIHSCSSSAAVLQLAQQQQQSSVVRALQEHLLVDLEKQRGPDIVKLLLFCAHLPPALRDRRLFEQAVPALYSLLSQLSAVDLARLLTAYTVASCYSQELFAALTEFVWDNLGAMSPAGLSRVAWAFAVADHYEDDEDLFNGIADAAVASVQSFKPDDLARLVWAFGRLRFSHAGLCDAALAHAAKRPGRFELSQLGRLLWGCAQLQHPGPPGALEAVAADVATRLRNLRTSTDLGRVFGSGGSGSGSSGGGSASHAAAASAAAASQLPGGGWAALASAAPAASAAAAGPATAASDGASDDDCRPQYEPADAMAGALADLLWSFPALGRLEQPLLQEVVAALGACSAGRFSRRQLALLWAAHCGLQELSLPILDKHPLTAESIKVFTSLVTRRVPRALMLPNHLVAPAFTSWQLCSHLGRSADAMDADQAGRRGTRGSSSSTDGGGTGGGGLTSWRFRDPAVLSEEGMVHSLAQALPRALPDLALRPQLSLDGSLRLPLTMKSLGLHLAWEPLAPAACSRNPPYAPLAPPVARSRSLAWRGWTVLQVPFYEWSDALEGGPAAQAAYLTGRMQAAQAQAHSASSRAYF